MLQRRILGRQLLQRVADLLFVAARLRPDVARVGRLWEGRTRELQQRAFGRQRVAQPKLLDLADCEQVPGNHLVGLRYFRALNAV